jgi:hypothetical protein
MSNSKRHWRKQLRLDFETSNCRPSKTLNLMLWNCPIHPALARLEVANATLFFDIEDGHRFVDQSGSHCKNNAAAFEKAKVMAIGVSLDKSAVDPTRRISVLNLDRAEMFIQSRQSSDIRLLSAAQAHHPYNGARSSS